MAPTSPTCGCVLTSGEPVPAAAAGGAARAARAARRRVGRRSAPATPSPRCRAAWCSAPRMRRAAERLRPISTHLEVVDPDERPQARRRRERHAGDHPSAPPRHRAAALSRRRHRHACRARRARTAAATGERVVATPRRTGNLVKCRGMLVNTDVILETLSAHARASASSRSCSPGRKRPGAMERLVIRIEQDDERGCAPARAR